MLHRSSGARRAATRSRISSDAAVVHLHIRALRHMERLHHAPLAGASARTLWCSWIRRKPSGVRFTIIVSAPGYSLETSFPPPSCENRSAFTTIGATASAESAASSVTSTAPREAETRARALRFSEEELLIASHPR